MTRERRGALLVAGAAILWSTGGLAIKEIDLSPLTIIFHRAWIATIVLLLLLRPKRIRPTATLFASMVVYAGMVVTFVVATKWTTAANAIFLQDSGIVWVLLLSPVIAHDAIRGRDVAAVAACLVGMTLFFVGKLSAHGMAGNLVALLSGGFYAVTVLLLRRQRGTAAHWTAIGGNALAAVIAFTFAPKPFSASAHEFAILLFLGIVQIGCAYVLFIRGLEAITAAEASIISLLEPILNPVWVFLGIGERPTGFAIAGAAIVVAAIAWRTLATGSSPTAGVPTPD
ncbi:MAG TPA: DMT family transporter [Thermoanaerobaculia bacterium]|nr:DMT family transporter [Thermoanaerobaculia bacterium]